MLLSRFVDKPADASPADSDESSISRTMADAVR